MEYGEDVSILPAFRKLVNLFWMFDQAGASDVVHNPTADQNLGGLEEKLRNVSVDVNAINDVQAVDICMTRAWMRVLLRPCSDSDENPVQIAAELLRIVERFPAAIEAHGISFVSFAIFTYADDDANIDQTLKMNGIIRAVAEFENSTGEPASQVLDQLRLLSHRGERARTEKLDNMEVRSPLSMQDPNFQSIPIPDLADASNLTQLSHDQFMTFPWDASAVDQVAGFGEFFCDGPSSIAVTPDYRP